MSDGGSEMNSSTLLAVSKTATSATAMAKSCEFAYSLTLADVLI